MIEEEKQKNKGISFPLWFGFVIIILAVAAIVLLGLLGISIMERRWEAQRPSLVLMPISEWEPDNAVWGQNYPREYETYSKTSITDTKTKFGGAFPRDYLDIDPLKVILYAGYGFSKEYLQARGHYYAVDDILKTKRIKTPVNAATCWTCKSTDVPRLMDKMGTAQFYAANWHDLKEEVTHPIGCQDCHDPQTMNLRITRPALVEAYENMNMNINEASHQQMRSLVCAQCHVEYYFKTDEAKGWKNYLVFPWDDGTDIEGMLKYFDNLNFTDFTHPISKTPIVKAQHPDYEIYLTGIHAYRGVSCADCHMPYHTEGGVKFTDHHVQSPLLEISKSCAVCHRWSEEEVKARVESIQMKVRNAVLAAEQALTQAHFDIAAAVQASVTDQELKPVRQLLRHAQFRWDYVSSNNGLGFHSPQECMRILGDSVNQAQQVRVSVARLLARKGISESPKYPDVSSREKAWEIAQAFVNGNGINLLP
jgi:nitrite reductase (cytochrome c-552)